MFSKKLFTTLLVISALSFSLYAQEIPKNPITLYNEATQLYFARNYKEAKKIFEQLLTVFPSDTSIYSYYFTSVEEVDGFTARITATEKCLPYYEAVSEEKRNEKFYTDYIYALRITGKHDEANKIQKISYTKFPNGSSAKYAGINDILKETDPLKTAKMLMKFYEEKENNFTENKRIAGEYLKLVSDNPNVFSKEIVLASGERLEKLMFDEIHSESWKQSQVRYFSTLLTISDNLRTNFPNESLMFLKKADDFYSANSGQNKKLKEKNPDFEYAKLKTYIALQDWSNASKIAAKFVENYQKTGENYYYGESESTLRFYYAKSLEGLKQISLAREQYAYAAAFERKYKPDFEKFSAKYPLSVSEKKVFDQKVTLVLEANIKTLEGKAKEKLLKEIIKKPAKDFKVTDFSGKTVSLADYRGKVLILNFWATWCGPCIAEFKELKIAYEKYLNDPKVAFAFVSIDTETEDIQPFLLKNGYNFPVWLSNGAIEREYEIYSGIPRLFLIDVNGNIRFDNTGFGKDGLYLKKLDWMIESALK
jgi:thiol-disulfide isomerase/thioredoxin